MTVLLDVTIKMSVIVAFALVAAQLLKRHSAAVRHWILAAAIACAAASPLVGLVVPSWRIDVGTLSSSQRGVPLTSGPPDRIASEALPQLGSGGVQTAISIVDSDPDGGRMVSAGSLLFSIWVIGMAAAISMLFIGLLRLRWLESRAAPVREGNWAEIAAEVADRYGLPRPPLVLQSDHPSLLVTWGFRQSKVILPAAAPTWTEDRIRIVLGHELAHIRRRDWLLQIAAEVVRCIYWFNPILWIGCRRLRQESEQACDDAVLQLGVDGRSYATHLLDLARSFRAHRRVWFPAPAIARRSSLERRVCAMLNNRVNRQPVTPVAAVAVVIALVAITIPIAGFTAFAQTRFATVSGTATDESGAVLANATLVLSNVQTSAKYEVRSNQSGFFEFVGLRAGDYELEVRLPGFEPIKDAVSVGVGETLQKNVTLSVGSVQETITVIGGPGEPVALRPNNRVMTAPAPSRRPCPNPAVGGCIGPPVKLKDVRPVYPPALRDTGVQGTVLIEGQIGTDGRMKEMRVVSSPHPALERSALDAVGEWEFTPTTLNDRVIDTRINVSVSFAASSQ